MSSKNERLRLADILDQIAKIEGYVGDLDERSYIENVMIVDATERCLERLIEAATKIGEARIAEIAPELPFAQLRGLGNRLRHAYDTIEAGRTFHIVRQGLPYLKAAAQAALETE